MKTPSAPAHPLVHEAAELGAAFNPFVLQNWPDEKLKALIESCDAMHAEATEAIDKWYEGELFKPENFLRKAGQVALDKARDGAHLQIIGVTAPLCAAAEFLLNRRIAAMLCSDCPPVGYPTDSTRCDKCPRKATLADVALPTYCGCNELLENIEQLETHVERGCWRKA